MTYKTVALLAEAEHKAQAVRKYDQNYALKLSGLNELTPVQLEAFDEWWSCFSSEMLHDASKDDPVYWLMVHKSQNYKKVKSQVAGKPIPSHEQEDFLEYLWDFSCKQFNRNYSEPRPMLYAKIQAIQSLNPNDRKEITWADLKRGYLIISTWYDKGRVEHSAWAAQIEEK